MIMRIMIITMKNAIEDSENEKMLMKIITIIILIQ